MFEETTEKQEKIKHERLNKLIARYIMSLNKDDGNEYKPDPILSKHTLIHQYWNGLI